MCAEKKKKSRETKSFKAEVKQVLDIVINSLYTHPEIFIRELISNSVDALEKMRHEALVAEDYVDKDEPLEIRITCNPDEHTLTVTDTGIGMTHDELVQNLGTIARSGTREFLENLQNRQEFDSDLIGKFGVGFYSTFMVGDDVTVQTRSYEKDAEGYIWTSDGASKYTITPAEDIPRGTSVTVALKEEYRDYENTETVRETIEKYSNFVPFEIYLNDEKVNTVQAIWTERPSEISDDEYTEFFKFFSNAGDDPLYHLHLTADAPLQLSSILYVPPVNMESFGFTRLKPSVNLYCRKVLVQQNAENLLPEYLRFVTGVVDSADLPLNISRETLQDNTVFRKLGKFLTRRFLKFLAGEADRDGDTYRDFWEKFGIFIKEGAVADYEHRDELSKLLRFDSSMAGDGGLVSLDEYVDRMPESQDSIYYLTGGSREEIEHGPYMSTFRSRNIEVLFLYEAFDDFVMTSLGTYREKQLVSGDSANLTLPDTGEQPAEETSPLTDDQVSNLATWMKDTLGDRVSEVRESKRPLDRPAIVVNPDDHMTTSMRKVLKASGRGMMPETPKVLEINPKHRLITGLSELRDTAADKGFLQKCVEQVYDNALAESGLLEEPGAMVERVYTIMEKALDSLRENGE